MSAGKYSPTTTHAYRTDQKWWDKNGGGYGNGIDPDSMCDDDGYDSYGYSGELGDGPDRAGNCEGEYLTSYTYNNATDELYHYLLEDVERDWSGKFAAGIKLLTDKETEA